jgi:hypothetical protein
MHDESLAVESWAEDTFGHAALGDLRRTRRLVRLVACAARTQASTVSGAVTSSAAREGAYRFLEQDAVSSHAVIDAACEATAVQCAKLARVYVAIDGSSLSLVDRAGRREVGQIGNWSARGRGLQTMLALAIATDGVPVGVADFAAWARSKPSNHARNRPARTTELARSLAAFDNVTQCMAKHAPDCQVVFVCDRGFDAHQCIELADKGRDFIIRATHNRRLEDGARGGRNYLHDALTHSPRLGTYVLNVPAAPGRAARRARVQVRARTVRIHRRSGTNSLGLTELNAVLVEEMGHGKSRVRWRLLTTLPIATLDDVLEIIRAYGLRWRIEELHRTWKDGGCQVEKNQLRKREAIIKWATILCTVAARILRLAQLHKQSDQRLATEEFSQFEIDATILLGEEHSKKERLDYELGAVPCVAEVIRAIAFIGGWSGQYSGKPPGPTVLGRGLERVVTVAKALEATERRKKSSKM